MARPIVLSNGELHVGLNNYGVVHDLYYPYVGLENHSAGEGLRHKVGVFVDGRLSWTDDGSWSISFSYPHHALIGRVLARNDSLGILLEFDDFVDAEVSIFMRNIQVYNLRDVGRNVKLFTYQAFALSDSRSNTDTAQYLPDSNAIMHYRGRRAMVVSGLQNDKPFDQHTIGVFGIEGREGSYKDAEDGELGSNTVEHGRVDSILRFSLDIKAADSERVHYWIAAGMSIREALHIHKNAVEQGLDAKLNSTADWWKKWLAPAVSISKKMPEQHQEMFVKSAMILKSQMDRRGAVIASTDSSMLNYSRDAYAYCWPRDGAYVLWPLIRMGYYQEAYRFFEFCRRGLHPSGYLSHKYRADGAIGSSWHPYVHDGDVAPPIQEDETALVVLVFVHFYNLSKDSSLIRDFYHAMIRPMADFMVEYVDKKTGLPKPSYDLWEEVYQTTTYTVSLVYGALLSASEMAESVGDSESAVKWQTAALDIQESAKKYLFNIDRGAFYKGVSIKDGVVSGDGTIDNSSIFGSFFYGLFGEGNEVSSSISKADEVFGFTQENPYLPRYENDNYRKGSGNITGNWWHIAALWRAQYAIENDDLTVAESVLDTVLSHATDSGMLGEQINPVNGSLISPAPLTWSHAEYMSTLLDYIGRQK